MRATTLIIDPDGVEQKTHISFKVRDLPTFVAYNKIKHSNNKVIGEVTIAMSKLQFLYWNRTDIRYQFGHRGGYRWNNT